jgi:fucokinase
MASPGWASVINRSRHAYVQRIAEPESVPWWTAVLVTASSVRQAERYSEEIRTRENEGTIPAGVLYLAVPDPDDRRIGTGGATLNALRALAEQILPGTPAGSLEAWWKEQRILMIHAGGDSRRLPQYSLRGKLFSALPVKTPWGNVSTVFDELLALSTAWVENFASGLLVAAGDVIVALDPGQLSWSNPGVCGVAIAQPVEAGTRHGVYVLDDQGRVYAFLQRPSEAEVKASGGLLPGRQVAIDTGLLRFDPSSAARLMELGGVRCNWGSWEIGPGVLSSAAAASPQIDLYGHLVMTLTGQWEPSGNAPPALRQIANALAGVPFQSVLVDGSFTHVGSTKSLRRVFTEETDFSLLYSNQDRISGAEGVIVDSAIPPSSKLASGAMAIECHTEVPLFAARGAVVHGITGIQEPVAVPEDTVVHQVPVLLPEGRRGCVVQVYGIEDDPKAPLADATWFGRPILEALEELGLDPALVWEDVPFESRSLWNARLFGFGTLAEAWRCARWLMAKGDGLGPVEWRGMERLSFAGSTEYADTQAIAETRSRRTQALWRVAAVSLATSGTDVRPLLAHSPGVAALAAVGRSLAQDAAALERSNPTEAASRYFQSGEFLERGGLAAQAGHSREKAFGCVRMAVDAGAYDDPFAGRLTQWQMDRVSVYAPARIDMGGGWSDTPPFCLDWGGTVLNIAILPKLDYPISSTVKRISEPVVRCVSDDTGSAAEYRSLEEATAAAAVGSSFAISLAALHLIGLLRPGDPLPGRLRKLGGGIEIRTRVALPLGSGLGTSSILAAALLRALSEMAGIPLADLALSDQVMRLEQHMTTGGGWQDQAGGIFPGAKLIASGPGLRQRLRIQPLAWSAEREREFSERFLLYYTGIRRMAKGLLTQVVGKYLAREVATVQVLHSIKTLASEMGYAMCEGEWDYLGSLIGRHWELNQVLDPHTINAPIAAILRRIRPHLAGAKLAGAGGGGFLMLLAKSPADADALREQLGTRSPELPGELYEFAVARSGLRVERSPGESAGRDAAAIAE